MSRDTYVCPPENCKNCEFVYSKQPLPDEIPYPPLKWLKPETQDAVFLKCEDDIFYAQECLTYAVRVGRGVSRCNEMRARLKIALHLRYLVQTDPISIKMCNIV